MFKTILTTIVLALTLNVSAQAPSNIPEKQNIFMRNGGELAHELAGHIIAETVGWIVFKHTKLNVGKGLLAGLTAGVAAGAFKEWVWDKYLGKGVFSIADFLNTCWGTLVGLVCEIPAMIIKIDKTYEMEEQFGNLNDRIFIHPSDSSSVTGDTVWVKLAKPILKN